MLFCNLSAFTAMQMSCLPCDAIIDIIV